jgi:hypothetical protein
MNLDVGCFLRAFGLVVDDETTAAFHKCSTAIKTPSKSKPPPAEPLPAVITMDQSIRCRGCGNDNEAMYDTTTDTAELVCILCGVVAVDHILFEGQSEIDYAEDGCEARAHASYPTQYNYLMSDEFNLSTTGSVSAMPRKDADTHRAIQAMEGVAARLLIPRLALDDGINLFARMRREKDRISNKDILQAACLYVAATALARKKIMLHVEVKPSIVCNHCSSAFLTLTDRAKHYGKSAGCRMSHRKRSINTQMPMWDMKSDNFQLM